MCAEWIDQTTSNTRRCRFENREQFAGFLGEEIAEVFVVKKEVVYTNFKGILLG